jgi:hypothetical protein
MLAASGLVTALHLALSLIVGLRLARQHPDGGPAPERALALYFLFYAFVGNIFVMTAYAAWADPSLGVPPGLNAPFNAVGILGNGIGAAAVYVFTWKSFRPHDGWARRLATGAILAMTACYALEGLLEGFAIRVVTGPWHFIGLGVRALAFGWMAGESLRYFGLLVRRLRLGLADPMVTNRFLLFGTWSLTTFATALSEVPARVLYMRIGGAGDAPIIEVAQPIIHSTILVTMILGAISACTLFLTFFPTEGYRRWVLRRARMVAS